MVSILESTDSLLNRRLSSGDLKSENKSEILAEQAKSLQRECHATKILQT
jgi:hypothetical protein